MNPEGYGQHLIATWMSQISLSVVLMVMKIYIDGSRAVYLSECCMATSFSLGMNWELI